MSPGGIDQYEVEVRIVLGHNPDLVVGDERIDLTQYATADALHALMRDKGFARRTDGATNANEHCYAWRDKGECVANPEFMRKECALACQGLADKRKDECAAWAKLGECDTNPSFMNVECPVSCGWKSEL